MCILLLSLLYIYIYIYIYVIYVYTHTIFVCAICLCFKESTYALYKRVRRLLRLLVYKKVVYKKSLPRLLVYKKQTTLYTVGFHNFNLRIFNLRVSNPNKLIVDVLLTRCRISMCQGLGPRNTTKFRKSAVCKRSSPSPARPRARAGAPRDAIHESLLLPRDAING